VGQRQLDSGGPHAFKWTLATGSVDLGVLTINGMQATASNALNICADTMVIVGSSGFDSILGNVDIGLAGTTPFRWTQATGMVDIGALPTTGSGGFVTSIANGVNADGSVVVGESSYGNVGTLYTHAFRWVLTPGTTTGIMTDIDGGAATVSSGFGTTTSAFRWTQATGMVNIGRLPGLDTFASAQAVSDDGNIIVGTSSYLTPVKLVQTAFRWTQATGIQNLNTLLTNAGVNLNGAVLQTAIGITGDGQFIVGNGQFAAGATGYIVRYCDATNMAACLATATGTSGTGTGTGLGGAGASGTSTGVIAGITTAASVQSSIDQVAAARRMILIQEFGEAAQLLGANERIGSGSEIGIFAAGGTDDSLDGGAAGRISYGNGFSVLAGLAGGEEHYDHVKTDATFMGALAVRYIYDTGAAWRPYGEVGAWGVPGASFTFTRTYANGAGASVGSSTVNATKYYAYGRLGAAFTPSIADEFALSVELGHGALHTGAFAETFSALNPFQASGASATDEMSAAKLRAQWTHAFTATIDATLWAAAADAFDTKTGFAAGIPGFGLVTPNPMNRPTWAEYGARIGYKITPATVVEVYADGVSGAAVVYTF
jgi:probable HAF family extracellular repeat protein